MYNFKKEYIVLCVLLACFFFFMLVYMELGVNACVKLGIETELLASAEKHHEIPSIYDGAQMYYVVRVKCLVE